VQKEPNTKTVAETLKHANRAFSIGNPRGHPKWWVERVNDETFMTTKSKVDGTCCLSYYLPTPYRNYRTIIPLLIGHLLSLV